MATVKFHFAPPQERTTESRQQAKGLGTLGEQMATRYLEEQGCTILDRNYRNGRQEVDIIALDHGELAVIEVKTRASDDFMAPELAVDHRKRSNIIRVANNYVRRHNRVEPLRFDIITVVGTDGNATIKHIKDAFNVMNR